MWFSLYVHNNNLLKENFFNILLYQNNHKGKSEKHNEKLQTRASWNL